jgi:hypothetical protein
MGASRGLVAAMRVGRATGHMHQGIGLSETGLKVHGGSAAAHGVACDR